MMQSITARRKLVIAQEHQEVMRIVQVSTKHSNTQKRHSPPGTESVCLQLSPRGSVLSMPSHKSVDTHRY